MGYAEFHLSSDSDQRSLRSTVSHPIFELAESVQPSAFTLKSASIPLTWCTLGSSSSFRVYIDETTEIDLDTTTIWEVTLPEGCYTLTTLKDTIKALIRGIPLAAAGPYNLVNVGAHVNDITYSTVNVSVRDDLRLEFFIADGFAASERVMTLEWLGGLKIVANRSSEEEALLNVFYAPGVTLKYPTKYPWRLIPNFIYLHSNIMTGTRYGRHLRPQGGFKSNTILAKIPIDFELVFGSQIMSYVNPSLDPAYLFGNHASFNQLEFWLTDERGTELDLQNVGFSLTLAMIL